MVTVTGASQRIVFPRTVGNAGRIVTRTVTEYAVGVASGSAMPARMSRTEADSRTEVSRLRRRRHSGTACWHARKHRLGKPRAPRSRRGRRRDRIRSHRRRRLRRLRRSRYDTCGQGGLLQVGWNFMMQPVAAAKLCSAELAADGTEEGSPNRQTTHWLQGGQACQRCPNSPRRRSRAQTLVAG